MLSTILIVVGAILLAIGIFTLIAIMIQPIRTAFGVVFKRRDDYVFYERKEGKALLARETRLLVRISGMFMFLGAVLLLTGIYLRYAPRGNGSLWSENTAGITEGEDFEDNNKAQGKTSDGKYISAEGKEFSYYISVTGTDVYYNGKLIGNIEEFKEYLPSIDRGNTIFLVDDFAASSTYQEVEKLLDQYGMKWDKDE